MPDAADLESSFQDHSCRILGNKGNKQPRIVAKFSQLLQIITDESSLGVKNQQLVLDYV